MELTNEFTVPLPPDRAWAVLTDLERIAPCLPGARLTEVDGGDHRGEINVKVGPIRATYKGVARLVEQDASERRVVLEAEGLDARQGSASARLSATLATDGSGTRVTVLTDLSVAGKVAQFGRGVLADVSVKLLDQFAACLSKQMEEEAAAGVDSLLDDLEPSPAVVEFAKAVVEAEPSATAAAGAASEAAPPDQGSEQRSGARPVDSPERDPVDLLSTAGAPIAKRLVPLGLAAAIVVLLLVRRGRR